MPWLTRALIRGLQRLHPRLQPGNPTHLVLGRRGEVEAFFYLRKLGYRMVATNFRAANVHGEIDLIGWDNDVLCFVEVKTRTDTSFSPPSTAVTGSKQERIVAVARRYLRRVSGERPVGCRFDIVSIEPQGDRLEISLQKGAFGWNTGSPRKRVYRDFHDRHHWRRHR